MLNDNMLYLTDSYYVSHWKQYPPGTNLVHSYLESRGGEFERSVFFGLQYFLTRYFAFSVNVSDVNAAADTFARHFGRDDVFNKEGWLHVVEKHRGLLPVEIHAQLEGTTSPTRTPLLTVENTCPECYWATGWAGSLLTQCWYPTTVASLGLECRELIEACLWATGGNISDAAFKLHDFGVRGSTSPESAAIGGAAHLLNFKGTDNLPALDFVRRYYGFNLTKEPAGFSIPATEHSTMTAWGEAHELDAFENMLDQFPSGTVAVVSDSYNIGRAVKQYWGTNLRDRVLARDGVVVVRPDSAWLPGYSVSATVLEVVKGLDEAYGSQKNAAGFKVLNPHIRVIQGDGVDKRIIDETLKTLMQNGYATENIAFGMGGALLQKLNRDTMKFAFKASYIEVNGVGRDVFKNPVGDPGKASRPGRIASPDLKLVFKDGVTYFNQTFDSIRERVAKGSRWYPKSETTSTSPQSTD